MLQSGTMWKDLQYAWRLLRRSPGFAAVALVSMARGVIAGGFAAVGLTRLLQALLFGVKPGDAITLFAAGGLLVSVAVIACLLPIVRAARIPVSSARRSPRMRMFNDRLEDVSALNGRRCRAVRETQLLSCMRLVGTLGRHLLIQIDAQARPVRRQGITLLVADAAAVEQILPVLLVAAMRDFLDGEVRRREVHVQRRQRADIALRIVRRELDPVRLGDGGDLFHFENAAAMHHVGLDVVHQVPLADLR